MANKQVAETLTHGVKRKAHKHEVMLIASGTEITMHGTEITMTAVAGHTAMPPSITWEAMNTHAKVEEHP